MHALVDLSAERAAAIDRAWQRDLEPRARLLLNGTTEPRKDGEEWKPRWNGGGLWAAPREVLEAAARERWPYLEDVSDLVVVAERLQVQSSSQIKRVSPEAYMASCAGGKEWIAEFRQRNPELTVGHAWTEYERAFGSSGQKLYTRKTFDFYFYSAGPSSNGKAGPEESPPAKPRGAKGKTTTEPRRSSDRQVKVAAQENAKAIVEAAHREVLQVPAPVSPTPPPVAVALGSAPLPHASTTITNADGPTLSAAAPVPSKSGIISIDGAGGSFVAQQEADGSWRVELAAVLPEALMAELAAVIWERVVGRPRGAAA